MITHQTTTTMLQTTTIITPRPSASGQRRSERGRGVAGAERGPGQGGAEGGGAHVAAGVREGDVEFVRGAVERCARACVAAEPQLTDFDTKVRALVAHVMGNTGVLTCWTHCS